MIKSHQRFFNIGQVLLDAISLAIAYYGSLIFKSNVVASNIYNYENTIAPLWMVPLLLITYYFMNVYSPMRCRLYRKEVLIIINAHLVGIVIIFCLLFLVKDREQSRQVSLTFAVFGLLVLLMERFFIRKSLRNMRSKGFNQKHMLIIGAGPVGVEFAQKVQARQEFGYNVVGFLDDDEEKNNSVVTNKPVLGTCDTFTELLANQAIDEVIVALPLNAHVKCAGIIDECEKAGVRVRIIPDYNKFMTGSSSIEEFDGIPLLNVRLIPLDDPFNSFIKRIFDIIASLIAIVLTGPVMIFIVIGIKLTSPGPVFFRQERVGLNHRLFNMFKFRSMRVATDDSAATFWTTPDDPRKTKFGSFLRKTSLDELPQFFNVLIGNMSVIGPRPERPFYVEQFKKEIPKYMVKHQVKPGITGWAQVNGWRGNTSIEKRIECDIYYIENWDLLFDIKILFLTVFKGLINKNAY